MCLGAPSPPKDNSAQLARQQEDTRTAAITQGRGKIDEAFGGFDDPYFQNYSKSYLDLYNPELDHKFEDARQTLRYDLSRKGTLDSTPGQTQFGKLAEAYTQQRQKIASGALDAVNTLRGNIENTKSQLYAQNQAAADPSLAATAAAGQVGALTKPPSYSPLGDVFGSLINSGAAYMYGKQRGLPDGYGELLGPGSSIPKSGSGRVVS